MKKLQFKLEGKQMLTKEQMKKISGGSTQCQLNGMNCGDPIDCDTDAQCITACCKQCLPASECG